jgi:hypothetical protein
MSIQPYSTNLPLLVLAPSTNNFETESTTLFQNPARGLPVESIDEPAENVIEEAPPLLLTTMYQNVIRSQQRQSSLRINIGAAPSIPSRESLLTSAYVNARLQTNLPLNNQVASGEIDLRMLGISSLEGHDLVDLATGLYTQACSLLENHLSTQTIEESFALIFRIDTLPINPSLKIFYFSQWSAFASRFSLNNALPTTSIDRF